MMCVHGQKKAFPLGMQFKNKEETGVVKDLMSE